MLGAFENPHREREREKERKRTGYASGIISAPRETLGACNHRTRGWRRPKGVGMRETGVGRGERGRRKGVYAIKYKV